MTLDNFSLPLVAGQANDLLVRFDKVPEATRISILCPQNVSFLQSTELLFSKVFQKIIQC